MPKGYDDEGLRIKKYEVELRLLRTHVATYTSTDVDTLSHSFTVGVVFQSRCPWFESAHDASLNQTHAFLFIYAFAYTRVHSFPLINNRA